MTAPVVIDGASLTLEDVERVAGTDAVKVEVSDAARDAITASRDFIEGKVAAGERVYGVTTGFGRLADVAIAPEERTALQHNLVRSNGGTGISLSPSAAYLGNTVNGNTGGTVSSGLNMGSNSCDGTSTCP